MDSNQDVALDQISAIINCQEFVQRLTSIISDSIYVYDLVKRKNLYINGEISKISGYSYEDFANFGDKLLDYTVHPADLETVYKHFNSYYSVKDGETLEGEFRFRTKSGKYIWLRTRERVFKRDDSGRPVQILGVAQDITKYKETEMHLKTLSDTFSSAFKFSGVGMALVDLNGKWIDVNNAVCEITGYTREELLQLTFQDITYPDDLRIDLNHVQLLLDGKIEKYNLEKRYITKQRKVVWVLLTGSLVRTENSEPSFFVAQIMDITKRKQLSDDLVIRNNELEFTKLNLIDKIAQLEELQYMVAHNLRGPAANIKTVAQALLSVTDKTIEPNDLTGSIPVKEGLAMIYDGSASLLNNLQRLLEIAKISLSRNITHEECNIEHVIQEVLNQLNAAIFEKQAIIHQNFSIKTISCPKIYLESILYNLLSNSLKYTHIHIVPEITVSTYAKGDKTILLVKDNGIGIDMEKYGQRVFKLNQVFHSGYDSTGIGLYITKAQVETLGGAIEVSSKPDEGSEFKVTFN